MPRRGQNIYKRKDGRWEGRYISGRRPDGKAVYRSVYAATWQEVRRRLDRAKSENAHAVQPDRTARYTLTVKTLSLQWLEAVQSRVKPATYARYTHLLSRHLLPALGEVQAERLTVGAVSAMVNEKLRAGRLDGRGGLSPKTVQDMVIILKSVLKTAELSCPLPNCAAAVRLPKAKPPELQTLSREEISRLETALRQRRDNSSAGVLLCLYTGIRLGEACALRWSDIDWETEVAHIHGTVSRLPCGEDASGRKTRLAVTSPKTRSADRLIPLPRTLSGQLRTLAACQDRDAFVLTGSRNRMMDPRTYQYRFQALLRELGIPHFKFHTLRHTFATECLLRGVDVKSLSETLGHSTVQMTLDRYVHPGLEARKRQLENLSFG